MRLAISNIAWDTTEDAHIAELLQSHSIDAIDIAPGKYFPEPAHASLSEIERVRDWWAGHHIEITGMQALLFGTTGLNVFGQPDAQQAMLQHLGAICHIAAELNAPRLVFGSPKNRDRSGLSDEATLSMAHAFFNRLGDIAGHHGVLICLEPNPTCYGANFMTTSDETAAVVRHIDHPAIRMQLDTGAITINEEDPMRLLEQHASLIGHVHASEPQLLPLGDGGTQHSLMAAALSRYLPEHPVSIEMVATSSEAHQASIARAVEVAITHYRTGTRV